MKGKCCYGDSGCNEEPLAALFNKDSLVICLESLNLDTGTCKSAIIGQII